MILFFYFLFKFFNALKMYQSISNFSFIKNTFLIKVIEALFSECSMLARLVFNQILLISKLSSLFLLLVIL